MAFINKVTVRGKTYNLENLTDGQHVVKLPTLTDDDVFVTANTIGDNISVSSLTNGRYTVNLPVLTQNDTFVVKSKQDIVNNSKVDKVDGKGLSTNDYTNDEKTKLSGIEEGANKYTLPVANSGTLGGVQPVDKTTDMTQEVGVGANGRLYTASSLQEAKEYTDNAIAGFNSYSIEVVDALPESGQEYTFYLIPKESGNGYDKYWWITDKDGTQKWDEFKGSSTLVVETLPESGDEEVDYILKSADGCLYYKWIDSSWKMIAGSLANIVDSLPDTGNEVTDYYVKNSNGLYVHYRYIDGAFCIIGGDTYTKEEINTKLTEIEHSINTLDGRISVVEAELAALGNLVADITKTENGIQVVYKDGTKKEVETADTSVKVEDITESSTGITVYYTDGETKDIAISGGGGGSSTSGDATITRLPNKDDSTIYCVYGDECNINYNFVATDSAGDVVGDGTATWYVNKIAKATSVARQGDNSFDIGPYLSVGSNDIKVSISVDTGGENPTVRTKTWTTYAINLYAKWDYNDTTINEASTIAIRWTPYGDVLKTTHIIIDGVEAVTSETSRNGAEQYVTIDKLSHGSHMVELYLTATINDVEIRSESIFHDMIFVDSDNNTPIIACSLAVDTMTQYNTLQIPIVIYTPNQLTSDATLAVNGEVITEWTGIDRTIHYWNYTPNDYGEKVLTITCGETVKTINLTVEKLDIDNEEIGGYTFRLKASDIPNNETLKAWTSGTTDVTFSDNFDWTNGGIQHEIDEDGNVRQYICVKAGTRMTINNKLFSDDATVNGKNFKIIFKLQNCRDYDAQVMQCYADSIGIQMFAHNASFSSSGTSLSVPYGEDEYIELEFEVYPAPVTDGDGKYRYMMAWIDGVITTCRVYNSSDNFTQLSADQQNIVIGSDDCDILVYMAKAYSNYLSRDNHIVNFIADAPNAQEMVKRYNRNDILNSSGEIDYTKLAKQNPDCRVWLYDIPRLTGGKKDKVEGCAFKQIWEGGDQYYQLEGIGTMTVQGTSSVDYLKGAANTDINFESGANHKLIDGNGNDLLDDSLKVKGFKIRDDSTPITYSNTKVNFASCEQVNNMCNAEWYQKFQPFQRRTPRDCMEFSMGVQFIKDQSGTLWDDGNYHMYSIANMGNSKKNVHVFHDTSNELECCIEVNNNMNDQCRMVSDDLTDEDWSGDHYFGMRYPDTKDPSTEIRNGWQRFLTWMATSNPNAATGDKLDSPVTFGTYTFKGHPFEGTQVLKGTTVTKFAGTYTNDTFEYRMAKMLSECEDYMVMDSVIYHFLYIERHTMCDNVSKNTFWSSRDCQLWDLSKNYDNDTSDGNNNEGQLVFDYGYEADDVIGTKTVFNAADAVWFVFASNLYEACRTMFLNRDSLGAWSKDGYHNYLLSEQKKIPERVWVQCYWYDYLRTYEQGINASWMSFLDGGQKTHQRLHYETFEEAYDSSKYGGTASEGTDDKPNKVTLRAYTPDQWTGVEPKSQLSIKMYNKCYIYVKVDQLEKFVKAEKGQTYTIDFSEFGKLNDTVININTANMIQEIGDISPLYPGHCSFTGAKRLRSIQIGSSVDGYFNSNFTGADFLNNTMLEYLYVQNLTSVNEGLDLTKCPSLTYFDASGSTFTAYDFATGGLLETAYIEAPTSLTLRDLNYLKEENLHITDYSKLLTLRLENCPYIDSLNLVTLAENLSIARIIGINWILPNTDVLERMIKIAGRDENNFNTDVSVLTGYAHVPTMREQRLNAYNAAWENLKIDFDTMVTQYLVTFLNADKTPIKDKNGNDYTQWVDQGATAVDPVESGEIDTPTMESTAEFDYTFSGWDKINVNVTEPMPITAMYDSVTRTYTVRWLKKTGFVLDTKTDVPYGSYLEYEGDYPTDTDDEISYIYRIFTGWDKSTAYITGDTDVYAVWDVQNGFPAKGTNLKDMTPVQIYAVATVGMADGNDNKDDDFKGYFVDKDYFEVRVGQDYSFSNVKENLIADELEFDGTSAKVVDTGIKLLGEDSGSFTMAIDFEFGSCDNDDTLLSCYEDGGPKGLRLKYNGTNPVLQWGDTSQVIGRGSQRDIIVLRHIKGEDILHVYSFNGGATDSDVYADEMLYTTLTWDNSTTTEMSVVLGGFKYLSGAVSTTTLGVGTIHWAKVWFEDLGDTAARNLAAWPHETWKFEYYGKDRYTIDSSLGKLSGASFISADLLTLTHKMNDSSTNKGGWDASLMRTFCNNRIYNAFPTEWKSIIRQVTIPASAGNGSTSMVYSRDYVYLPSYIEMSGITDAPYSSEGKQITFFEDNNARIKLRNGTAYAYWGRSPIYVKDNVSTSGRYFLFVGENGACMKGGYTGSTSSIGICPCISINGPIPV